jgi:hypothetical protein
MEWGFHGVGISWSLRFELPLMPTALYKTAQNLAEVSLVQPTAGARYARSITR